MFARRRRTNLRRNGAFALGRSQGTSDLSQLKYVGAVQSTKHGSGESSGCGCKTNGIPPEIILSPKSKMSIFFTSLHFTSPAHLPLQHLRSTLELPECKVFLLPCDKYVSSCKQAMHSLFARHGIAPKSSRNILVHRCLLRLRVSCSVHSAHL